MGHCQLVTFLGSGKVHHALYFTYLMLDFDWKNSLKKCVNGFLHKTTYLYCIAIYLCCGLVGGWGGVDHRGKTVASGGRAGTVMGNHAW